jgi:hypothetical protein
MVAITLGALYQSFSHLKEETEFRTHTIDTLKEIQDGMKGMRTDIDGMKLKQIGSNPANPENIIEAKSVLTAAAANKVRLDPSIVRDVGGKFIQASRGCK